MLETQGPRASDIQGLFSSVAHGYDRANDFMTFGLVRLWRKKLVEWSGVKDGGAVLDCATGTGDLAIEFKRSVKNATVVGTDFCKEMLALAPNKAEAAGLKIDFQLADLMNLPFKDATFDVCSIAYGIRNVEDAKRGIAEMARVVKPGGSVMILETGDSQLPFMDLYFRYIVPRIGGWVTRKREAYEYLNRSSRGFPSRQNFLNIMTATGRFSQLQYRSFMGGASFLYKGTVSN